MGAIFSPPRSTPPPAPAPEPPQRDDPVVIEAAQRARLAAARARGRAATLLTGPHGLTGDAPAVRKTLLGE
jgi:hypothetical protein